MHLRLVFVPRRFFIAYFPVNNSLVPAGADKFLTGTFAPIKKTALRRSSLYYSYPFDSSDPWLSV